MQLDPTSKATLHLKLYRNVKNVPELRRRVTSGELKCCVIKPSLILDPFQVVVAANKTATADKLKTRSVYSELLFNLSVSKNISQSLQLFGIDDRETDILVAVLGDEVWDEVQGEEVDLAKLDELCDRAAIRKAYRIGDVEFKEMNLLDSVVSRIAAKDCLL